MKRTVRKIAALVAAPFVALAAIAVGAAVAAWVLLAATYTTLAGTNTQADHLTDEPDA